MPNLHNTSSVDFTTILERMSSVRVLVIGDVMLDHYVWGDVERISPEAPVPVVRVKRETHSAGGAANVALNLSSLGVQVDIAASWGQDTASELLVDIMKNGGVKHVENLGSASVSTIVKKRVVARNQQLCRVDFEGPTRMYSVNTERIEAFLSSRLSGYDAVIVSDYAKGVITQDFLDRLMEHCLRQSIPVAVDPKPTRKLVFRKPWLITPNRSEALLLCGAVTNDAQEAIDLDEIFRRLQASIDPQILVVTLGAEGMAICQRGAEISCMPTIAREVFDVSGAGDTVIATLVAASLSGADCYTAAHVANIAAGCVVGHLGTIPIDKSELLERLS